ncbi:MAG: hypothetical protein QOJ51_4824 [Acidobacteriaceae bacterium]|jgi:hypothetical protein|nr:hypothetical protein [Acidobacteriaceae bacterium]
MREHSPERTRVAKILWGSLKPRILWLAVLACLFLTIAAVGFFAFLRSSHAATLSMAERHLVDVASSLVRDYTAHAAPHVNAAGRMA